MMIYSQVHLAIHKLFRSDISFIFYSFSEQLQYKGLILKNDVTYNIGASQLFMDIYILFQKTQKFHYTVQVQKKKTWCF